MNIKPCQQHLFANLDATQLTYAETYGYEGSELSYRDFKVQSQIRHTDPLRNETVTACCREHARDLCPGAISISRD